MKVDEIFYLSDDVVPTCCGEVLSKGSEVKFKGIWNKKKHLVMIKMLNGEHHTIKRKYLISKDKENK